MSGIEKELDLIAYCGIYCRQCDYFTCKISVTAKGLGEVVKNHSELKLFADASQTFDYDNFLKGLEWLSKEVAPCIGACKGGGGWEDCPIRKCCKKHGLKLCSECEEFPCETLNEYPTRVEQLSEIRKIGLETWIKKNLM